MDQLRSAIDGAGAAGVRWCCCCSPALELRSGSLAGVAGHAGTAASPWNLWWMLADRRSPAELLPALARLATSCCCSPIRAAGCRRRRRREKVATGRRGEERTTPGLLVTAAASRRKWTENEREEEVGRR
ncbi:hypothetical protein KY285_010488 [Solanum tuberosum]|nr:hypothetical protein KY285_010488 [Solanum tuberosum]